MKKILTVILLMLVFASPLSFAKGRSSGSHSRSSRTTHTRKTKTVSTIRRDRHGHIRRSESAKHTFMKSNPCPSTGRKSGACPGYTVDHIRPLARGGADSPSNMQWQTTAAAKEKDKWERK